jgi:hypothetical protein
MDRAFEDRHRRHRETADIVRLLDAERAIETPTEGGSAGGEEEEDAKAPTDPLSAWTERSRIGIGGAERRQTS